ncbi:hypothetical protein [Nodularia spumigena]|jgi:hypothetical protein|uniref:DUF2281 domain-containing protein n=1 Tax=Nodularia spumigena UHCC 0060 TaxID=3110300 RepID=A0ABU5ULT2_NODSP|nr:hypothetical protein [Nodularia spumigena]MEA5523631.1 hypothetical protein [Nodularia spumigena UHCC 0143]MEA5555720.1 hypothetical protein [Nodularia spumigena CH309]MEA5607199.1 hypothetical protein [Nodularia spumigena UHCC 0060]MEA5613881.1 hypothetical protein [Nodularia spumigena UHCC 0040]
MTFKEELVAEIETMTEAQIAELLIMVKNIKTKKAKPPQRPGSGKSILRHAGKWQGEDLKDCLQAVYDSRGVAEF